LSRLEVYFLQKGHFSFVLHHSPFAGFLSRCLRKRASASGCDVA
jgi:hypothetical protein